MVWGCSNSYHILQTFCICSSFLGQTSILGFIKVFNILSSSTNWKHFIQNSIVRKPGQLIATLHSLSSGNVRTVEEDSGWKLDSGLSGFTAGESAKKETLAWSSSSTDTSFPTFSQDQCRKSQIYDQNIWDWVFLFYKRMKSYLANVIWPKACYKMSFLWQLWHKVCHLLKLRMVIKITM